MNSFWKNDNNLSTVYYSIRSSIRAASSAAAESPDDYHLYASITYPGTGGGGRAFDFGTVCSSVQRRRSNINYAYSDGSCNDYNPPERIDCTPTNRIILTAEVILFAYESFQ